MTDLRQQTKASTRLDRIADEHALHISNLQHEINELCRRHGEALRYALESVPDTKPAGAVPFLVASQDALVPLDAVLCTDEWVRRSIRPPDYEAENRAMALLAQKLADSPGTVLQTLADTALDLLQADSAGISLLTKDEKRFVWPAIAGAWKAHAGGGTPRDFGPCGDVLDGNVPLLFTHFERRYPYLLAMTPLAEECLVVPLYVQGKAIGTIWAIAHDARRKFDAGDLRQLTGLGRFASAACRATAFLDAALGLQQDAVQTRQEIEKLRESEENYRLRLESIDEGFCIIEKLEGETLDFRYVETNPAFAAKTSLNDVVGKTLRQVLPDEFEERLQIYDAVIRTGEPIKFQREFGSQGRVLELYAFRVDDKTNRRVAINFEDITERKQAEALLVRQAAELASLYAMAPVGLFMLDTDLRFVRINQFLANLNGLPAEQLIGRTLRELLAADLADATEPLLRQVIETGLPVLDCEVQGATLPRSGEHRHWLVSYHPVLAGDGTIRGVHGAVQDITERKWIEEALRESQRFLRSSLDALSGHIAVLDESGTILEINEAWHRFAIENQAAGACVGVGVNYLQHGKQALLNGGEVPAYAKGINDVIAGRQTRFEMEYPCHSPTEQRWFVMRVTRFQGPGPIRIVIVHDNCTERKLAQDALRQSEQRFRALFDWGPVAMHSCDRSGTILEFNRGAVALWGRRPQPGETDEQFRGSFKFYRPDGSLRSYAQTGMTQVLRGEITAAHNIEVVVERPDGLRMTVVGNIVPLKNGRGEITGAINCFYDITERSRLERQAQEQAQVLVDLHRRKDEFLAMLSHELRNPLAALVSAVQLLHLQKNEEPLQQQALNVIERQVGQLKHLVDDLLDISRITSGSIRLRQQRVSVNDIVERALDTARPLIVQRRHELTVLLPPQPVWLYADATRLEQVLVNLLANAAKYTDEGGRIWLSVEQEGAADVVLKVRDTGIGMAPELLPHIFELFTQAERSIDRSQGGLGIGLCLVQRLVELHAGTVNVYSVVGQGSEFVVRLPVMPTALPPSLPPPAIKPAQPAGKACRVLAVDDNVDAVQNLALLLKMSGHEVQLAYDGPSALEAALAMRPDVVLLDIGLPGLTGYEVAEQMRQQPEFKNTVLVALTGYGREADRQRSRDAGFDHHLVKPADLREVEQILATVAKRPA